MAKKLKSSINSGKKPTKTFKKLVDKTGNEKTKKIAKERTKELLKQSKTESFSIDGDHLVMYLHDSGAKNSHYVRVDLNDYYTFDKFYMIMDKPTLKGMADFIYKYLENE